MIYEKIFEKTLDFPYSIVVPLPQQQQKHTPMKDLKVTVSLSDASEATRRLNDVKPLNNLLDHPSTNVWCAEVETDDDLDEVIRDIEIVLDGLEFDFDNV
jgi:hypothetical protein